MVEETLRATRSVTTVEYKEQKEEYWYCMNLKIIAWIIR
jgi:hypothetical protein